MENKERDTTGRFEELAGNNNFNNNLIATLRRRRAVAALIDTGGLIDGQSVAVLTGTYAIALNLLTS